MYISFIINCHNSSLNPLQLPKLVNQKSVNLSKFLPPMKKAPSSPKPHRNVDFLVQSVKKTLLSALVFLTIISINFLVTSCGKNEKRISVNISPPQSPNLKKQSIIPPLYISFAGSVSKIEDVQNEITNHISINPKIQGIWKWAADNKISFHPSSHWKPGTEYDIEMEPELFAKHIKLEKYKGSFTTYQFRASIASSSFHIDPTDEDVKQIIATIKFSHPVDPETFEKRVLLRPYKLDKKIRSIENRDYRLTITYDDFFSEAYIVSESLPIPEDDVQMQISISKGVGSSWKGNNLENSLSASVRVAGMLNFARIESVQQTIVRNEAYQSEQILVVDTKGKVKPTELMKNMEVLVLPDDRPETAGLKAQKDYHWSDVKLIGPEVRKLSSKVNLELMETEHEYEEINSFRLKVPPLKYLYLKIKKGATFYGKYYLSSDYETIIKIKAFPEVLEIMHEGIILSSTGEKKISIMSQGVKRVRFEIGRVLPGQINHLITQSNGNLTNLRFSNGLFSEDNIVENYEEIRNLRSLPQGESNFFSFDFSKYLGAEASGKSRNGIFFFKVISERSTADQRGRSADERLIMVSDLGVLIKESVNKNRDVFVQSIKTGDPVSDVKVQVLGKNGIPILSSFTNAQGHASFPSLSGFKNEKSPTVFVVSKGNDLSFMPVQASGRWLNYSKFDVGGVHLASDPSNLQAYLFSDRGIYRPGDAFNIGMIIKSKDWKGQIAGTPLEASIVDSRGLEIFKNQFKLSAGGFEEMKYKTENSSPTGIYRINLYTIRRDRRFRSIGSTTVSIEEFLPDRLNIVSVIPGKGDKAWISPEDVSAQVTLRNLFGSPASGNRVSAKITFSPGRMYFPAFRDFKFHDPFSSGISYTESLEDQTTDNQGKTTFDLDLARFDVATYNLTFVANGFEKESGRNVTTVSTALISPLKYLLGTKANGDLSYIYRNSERSIKVIAVDADLKTTAVQSLDFIVNRIDQTSVLTKMPNGIYAYKSVSKSIEISNTKKNLGKGGLDFRLPTDDPGEFELIVKNSDGVEFVRRRFTVVGMGNLTRSLDKTAELDIKLNKADYEPGEEIEIYVKAPYTGAGIITIEKDKVYETKWFKTDNNSFLTTIRVPADMEGNGYINVAFVRAADSKNIYMSPLSYGVASFAISKRQRINPITLDVPARSQSGEAFPIRFRTEKPCKIAVFAVDEGILQVADYKTPDPLGHFFKKAALEVKTTQLLDLILPEFSLSQRLSAMGGDSRFDEAQQNLNPFRRKQHKPVVYWSGIVSADAQFRKLEYMVPDYFNGTLRVIAVAVSADAIGVAEEKAIVKNPFVISPNVPMFAAPTDSFEITVTVTNGIAGSGRDLPVRFEIVPSAHLSLTPTSHNLSISEDRDTTIRFQVKVNKLLGAASISFKASSEQVVTHLASYLSIRPPIPYQTSISTGRVIDETTEIKTSRRLYEEYRILNVSASYLPQGLAKGLLQYLDKFPYGCTEQIVSQGFPYLFLENITDNELKISEKEEKIGYTLKVLQARQNDVGKFGIWAANSHTSDFMTVYCAHFITHCKILNYGVSERLYQNTMDALKKIAQKPNIEDIHELRNQAYAIYVLTLNEIVTTNYITSLRKQLDVKFEDWQEDLTAGYIAASYILMKQEQQGNRLLRRVARAKFRKRRVSWNFYSSLMHNAQILYLLASHAPDELDLVSADIIQNIVVNLEKRSYNTLSSSYSIMALDAYAKAANEPSAGAISIVQLLRNKQEKSIEIPKGSFPVVEFSENANSLRIGSKGDQPAYFQVIQAGYDLQTPNESQQNSIEVSRSYKNLNGNDIQSAALGEEIEIHVKFRSLSNAVLYDIAVIDLLPAGLEVNAIEVRKQYNGSWTPEHIDVREDRVLLFGSVRPEIQEITYKARAINKGTFVVPPLYSESMYDNSIYGISPSQTFTVN
jgi:uncharacterized protein YfaS (alpha-2-macroglobulin family)